MLKRVPRDPRRVVRPSRFSSFVCSVTHLALAAPRPSSSAAHPFRRNAGTREPSVPQRRRFKLDGSTVRFPDPLPDPWRLAPGAEQTRQVAVPSSRVVGGCQSSPLGLIQTPFGPRHQPPANHPKSIDSSKSFPRMTCQAALDSLHANAFIATGTLRRRFLRSYQAAIFG